MGEPEVSKRMKPYRGCNYAEILREAIISFTGLEMSVSDKATEAIQREAEKMRQEKSAWTSRDPFTDEEDLVAKVSVYSCDNQEVINQLHRLARDWHSRFNHYFYKDGQPKNKIGVGLAVAQSESLNNTTIYAVARCFKI